MRIESMNRPVLDLDDTHPAKKFLNAFMDCLADCAGRELGLDGETPIDQEWRSATDGRVWTFSGFVYAFLCFDILLDGFLESSPSLTESEKFAAQEIPRLRSMMEECAQAAQRDGNRDILELTDQVMTMLSLWEQYLSFRQGMVSNVQRNELTK
jgi:hypothetical protein